jgi:hypothetical protein
MNPTKLDLHFSGFSVIFYAIYKIQLLFKNRFAARTLEVFVFLQKCPYFADKPSGRKGASQCGPWAAGRRGSGQIPAGAAAGWSG